MNWAESFRDVFLTLFFLGFLGFGLTQCNRCTKETDKMRMECIKLGKSTEECRSSFNH